jgi:hypothetical protein
LGGKPLPECRTVLLSEVGYSHGQHGRQFTWELGGIRNISKHHALGATSFLNMDDDNDMGFGLKARYRFWLSRTFSINVAPGVLLTRANRSSKGPDFFGHADLCLDDWLSLAYQIDEVKKSSPPSHYTNYSMGVRIGGSLGMAMIAGSVLALFVVITAMSGSMS